MRNELRLASRRLMSSPTFTVTAVLTLGLGIGAITTIFSVVDAVLLRPLPYAEPEQLVAVEAVPILPSGERLSPWPWAYPRFEVVRERMRSFASIAAFDARPVSLTGAGSAERLQHEAVSSAYFEMLGARPQRGRLFSPADDVATDPQAVAVISHALWQRRFGGGSQIVGSAIRLNDVPFTVIGVLPARFRGMGSDTEVWTPMAMAPTLYAHPARLTEPRAMWHQVAARVRPDVSITAAAAELAAVRTEVEERYPGPANPKIELGLRPLLDAAVDPALRRSIWILFAAVVFVLLITVANVSNLLVTRTTSYRGQFAIRRALGASRAALARITIAEALVLALLGGVLGVLVAFWGIELLTSLRPEGVAGFWSAYARVVDADTVGMTAGVFAFNFGIALLTGLAFASLPAVQLTRVEIADVLRGRSAVDGTRGRTPLRSWGRPLIVLQMATATVLATGAALTAQSFARLMAADLGTRHDRLLTFRVDLPRARYDDEQTRILHRELEAELAALPGVTSVALANSLPVSGQMASSVAAPAPLEPSTGIGMHMASAGFFRTLGIPLLEGRDFTPAEFAGAAAVAVINETAARTFFPDGNAIGQRLVLASGLSTEIIGVVADVRYDAVEAAAGPDLYLTNAVFPAGSFYALLRTRGAERALITSVQQKLHAIDPTLPAFDVRTMDERVRLALSASRFITAVLGVCAMIAFAIAGIGVYGVVSYLTGARVREIAIRMALGARPNRVLGQILLDVSLVSLAALIIGVPATLVATRVLASLLYGVTPHDVPTIIGVALLVVVTALLATWHPARRAARTDPMTALRHD